MGTRWDGAGNVMWLEELRKLSLRKPKIVHMCAMDQARGCGDRVE